MGSVIAIKSATAPTSSVATVLSLAPRVTQPDATVEYLGISLDCIC